jgi:hypothetical protein
MEEVRLGGWNLEKALVNGERVVPSVPVMLLMDSAGKESGEAASNLLNHAPSTVTVVSFHAD